VIWDQNEAEYFCKQDWSGQISLMRHEKLDFRRSDRMASQSPKLLVSRQTQADGTDPMPFPVTEHVLKTKRHTTAYLACGAPDGPLIIFLHGWPELAISWLHQLPVFAELGFFCVAPDMRGYGRSSVYDRHADYAFEHSVRDMFELQDSLGQEKAVWVGHDSGSLLVWAIASHHPDRCRGVVSLCIPYLHNGFVPDNLIPLVDRAIYPEDTCPAGQWDYQLFYEENFLTAHATFEADTAGTIKAIFRSGNAALRGKPSRTSRIRRDGGWFGGGKVPDVERDAAVLTEADLCAYTAALERNGWFGPCSWYMNHKRNAAYAATALNQGRLSMPVLFLDGANDLTCMTTVGSRLAEPMRQYCDDLTEVTVQSGHSMAQECLVRVNAALAKWLATKLTNVWPA
jgi:pimeloyl-ACP methyl ester carboxylesterase